MLRIGTSDSNALIITPELTRPFVYLDYCVIVELAGNAARGVEVREALLGNVGTLYLSWAHLIELFGLGIGPTYERIRAYLASFGRSFVLCNSDTQAVIDREARWEPGRQNPALDEDLLRALAANWDGRAEPDLTNTPRRQTSASSSSFASSLAHANSAA